MNKIIKDVNKYLSANNERVSLQRLYLIFFVVKIIEFYLIHQIFLPESYPFIVYKFLFILIIGVILSSYKILKKEFLISFIVAVVLAAINFLRIITLTKTPLNVAMTVSVTLIFVVIISKIIGAFLPVIAKTFKMDPAIMAGPLITTILDALTLTIYFRFATMFLSNVIK